MSDKKKIRGIDPEQMQRDSEAVEAVIRKQGRGGALKVRFDMDLGDVTELTITGRHGGAAAAYAMARAMLEAMDLELDVRANLARGIPEVPSLAEQIKRGDVTKERVRLRTVAFAADFPPGSVYDQANRAFTVEISRPDWIAWLAGLLEEAVLGYNYTAEEKRQIAKTLEEGGGA